MDQRGFGLVEIVIVVAIVALAGFLLMRYVGSTATTVETMQRDRPLARSRLAADEATIGSMREMVRNYQAQNDRWPADKAAVLGLMMGPPRFQCPGNDFDYDPATGTLRLTITDDAHCS